VWAGVGFESFPARIDGGPVGWSILEPEVAGGWGSRTVADATTHPPRVSALHYQFDGWQGDDLLESFPCFIVTRRLGDRLAAAGLTGDRLAPVEVTRSEQFESTHPGRELPAFEWLQVTGAAGCNDFGLTAGHRLVVSERALAALKAGQLRHCEASAWEPG